MPRRRRRFLMIREDLRKHPNVISMALALDVDRDLVVGKLIAFWDWVKKVSRDGHMVGVPMQVIDLECALSGFAEQLRRVGWLAVSEADPGEWTVPEFEAWLSEGAEKKADAAARQAASRAAQQSQVRHAKRKPKRDHIRSDHIRSDQSLFLNTEEAILSFPTRGKEQNWHLLPSKVEEFRLAFPEKDIVGESRKALAWLLQDTVRLKTARGMGKFLYSWLSRAQDRPGAFPGMAAGPPPSPRPAGPARPTGADLLEQIRREQQHGQE